MSSVSREKYERAKKAVISWYNTAQKLKLEVGVANSEVFDLQSKLKKSQQEINLLPDSQTLEDLEIKNKEQNRTIRNLTKQISELEEKYKNKIVLLERDKLLSDGRVQQLEEARKDLQERYKDLKDDLRSYQQSRPH